MPINFGLGAKPANAPASKAKAAAKPRTTSSRAFGAIADDDEHEEELAQPRKTKTKLTLKRIDDADAAPSSNTKDDEDRSSRYADASAQRTAAKHSKAALELDSSIYDYDAAYDALHARDAAKKAAEKAAANEGKSRYIDGLLASAEVRKRDQLRAREKVLQRERENEGEDFADKEKFVTGAYKTQQEEVKRMEEEEKRKDEEEDRRRKTQGMTGFYKNVIADQERRYQEITTAAAEAEKNGLPIDTEQSQDKTATEQAREINAKGGNVLINDDGQVVDKRELLSGGLNVVSKPSSANNKPNQARSSTSQNAYQGRGNAKSSRERQTRMLEAQFEQAAKRAADEEAEEQRQLEHKAKSKKTEDDISSAKERYLARKKAAAEAAQGT